MGIPFLSNQANGSGLTAAGQIEAAKRKSITSQTARTGAKNFSDMAFLVFWGDNLLERGRGSLRGFGRGICPCERGIGVERGGFDAR
jgi:hypothetical protein